jgi:hypothetical protein
MSNMDLQFWVILADRAMMENLFYFATVSYFEDTFFKYFHGQNKQNIPSDSMRLPLILDYAVFISYR